MSSRDSGTYKLNVRFLAFLIGGVVIASVGIFLLHRFQKGRLVNRFLDQANIARDAHEPFKELDYLQQYIGLNPTNAEARVRYGMVLAKYQKNGLQAREAYFALQEALQRDPNMPNAEEVRIQCVKLALRPGLDIPYSDAIRELDILRKDKQEKSEYEEYYATALMNAGQYAKAEEFLTRVVNRDPNHFEAAMRLAWIKREKMRVPAKDVDEFFVRKMLQQSANANNPRAWLRAASYYRYYDEIESYGNAVNEAKRLVDSAPSTPPEITAETYLNTGELLMLKWRKTIKYGVKPVINDDFRAGIAALEQCLQRIRPLPPVDPMPEIGSVDLLKLEIAAQAYQLISRSYALAEDNDKAEKFAREQVAQFPDEKSLYFLPLQIELLDALVRQKKYDEAEQICQKFTSRGFAPAIVELQRGFMAAHRSQWIDAARHLERCVTEMTGFPDLARRARFMLAMCYEKTQQYDRLLQVLQDAVPPSPLDPLWVSTKYALAEVQARLNRIPAAIASLKEIIKQQMAPGANPDRDPGPLTMAVNLMLQEQAKGDRPKDPDLETFLKMMPSGPRQEILRAQEKLTQKQTDEARQILDDAMKKWPEAVEIYMARFNLEMQVKNPAGAKDAITRTEAKFGDNYETRQMKITLTALQAGGDAAKAPDFIALANGLEKFNPDQQLVLWKSLSMAARQINRRDLAWQWLEKAEAVRGSQDLDLQYQRFDLALLDGDDARIQSVLTAIRTVAGGEDNSSYRLPAAFYLLHKADKLTDKPDERRWLLDQANSLLGAIENTRERWNKLALAQAKVNDMLGRRDIAIDKYRLAIDLGEIKSEIISRYIELCFLERKSDRVQAMLRDHPEIKDMLGGEPDKVIQILMEGGFFVQALDLAKRVVPDDCQDPVKLFWLARVQNTCRESAAAEATLRKASTLKYTDGNLWLAFVQILVKNNKMNEAKDFVARTSPTLTVPNAKLFIAQALLDTGSFETARPLFEELYKEKPDDLPTLISLGGFYFRIGETQKAAPIMEKIIQHPGRSQSQENLARRTLALCVVASGDHTSGMRALGILGFKTPDAAAIFNGHEPVDDLRGRFAVLSVIKGRNARTTSLTILREIERRLRQEKLELSAEELRTMGQIQYALGDLSEANRLLSMAANSPNSAVVNHAIYAIYLLRTNRLQDADREIKLVAAAEPGSRRHAELAARHATLSGNSNEAIALLRRWASSKDGKPEEAAAMLEQLGYKDEATPLFAQAAEKQPEFRALYAEHLARRGKAEESIAEFEKCWDALKPEMAVQILCNAMLYVSDSVAPAVVSKASALIDRGVKTNANLLPFVAAFKSLYPATQSDSIAIMRQILDKEPKNVFTLNNLAFMLALKDGKFDEAVATIRKAIEIAGPQPTLLDTEAVILIAAGRPKDAIDKLGEVMADDPSATAYLHLAQAYLAANQPSQAKDAAAEAVKHNLRLIDFHPLERKTLERVLTQLTTESKR